MHVQMQTLGKYVQVQVSMREQSILKLSAVNGAVLRETERVREKSCMHAHLLMSTANHQRRIALDRPPLAILYAAESQGLAWC
jgi:hypothetical protein